MGDIKVTFWGICTYIEAHHRMVLVNAGTLAAIERDGKLAEHHIHPHHARLHLRVDDVLAIGPLVVHSIDGGGHIRFDLDQVALAIANTMEPRVLTRENQCLPHLKNFAEGELGPPNHATEVGNSTMACFFNFSSGTLVGRTIASGAGVNILTASTLGDPQLTISPFDGRGGTEIRLRSGSSILITNLPDVDKGADSDSDFLLHYLTADAIPNATFPHEVSCNPVVLDDFGLPLFVSAGCSNSNYP